MTCLLYVYVAACKLEIMVQAYDLLLILAGVMIIGHGFTMSVSCHPEYLCCALGSTSGTLLIEKRLHGLRDPLQLCTKQPDADQAVDDIAQSASSVIPAPGPATPVTVAAQSTPTKNDKDSVGAQLFV